MLLTLIDYRLNSMKTLCRFLTWMAGQEYGSRLYLMSVAITSVISKWNSLSVNVCLFKPR